MVCFDLYNFLALTIQMFCIFNQDFGVIFKRLSLSQGMPLVFSYFTCIHIHDFLLQLNALPTFWIPRLETGPKFLSLKSSSTHCCSDTAPKASFHPPFLLKLERSSQRACSVLSLKPAWEHHGRRTRLPSGTGTSGCGFHGQKQ